MMARVGEESTIVRDGCKIYFSGNFYHFNAFHNLLKARREIHEAVARKKFQDILLDFSDVTFITHELVVSVISQINHLKTSLSINFKTRLPKLTQVENLFLNANWAYYLDDVEYSDCKSNRSGGNHFPLTKVVGVNAIDGFVDEICEFFLAMITNMDRESLSAIEYSLNEILDNAINHSEAEGCFVSIYNTDDVIKFIIVDEGIGIKKSMQKNHPDLRGDIRCIEESIKEGVSGTGQKGRGNGLYISCQMAQDSGFCRIWSGMGYLQLGENADLRAQRSSIPMSGTYVQLELNYRKRNLLDNALGEKTYEPDYLERKKGDGEEYNIVVNEEEFFGGTRDSGKKFYTKVFNILQSSHILNIDFKDVSVITSSFADEAFATLFMELGPSSYMQRIKIQNISPLITKIIDRAITKRLSA